jgi:energy-coupling factor transporter ATP-binding protein EcfA2
VAAPIQTLSVQGLFGYLGHHIAFRPQGVTILSGPNGSGKTHVLKILRALVGLDLFDLLEYPFASAVLSLRDGNSLRVTREDGSHLTVEGWDGEGELGQFVLSSADLPDPRSLGLPPWIDRVGPDQWFDAEQGQYLSGRELAHLYSPNDLAPPLVESHPWLATFVPNGSPTFIETERLDVAPERLNEASRATIQRHRRPRAPEAAINRYVERITSQIASARRTSLSVSESADRQFAARALDKARATLREPDLRRRYAEIAALHRELYENGLTEQTIDVAFPEGRTNPTERRILNLFLDDWEQKLAPLQPVHEKLQILRDIIDLKMPDKRMTFSEDGNVTFVSPVSEALPVDHLSSGEQHMLALFTMLLFTAEAGALVLIDEPEISLHAAWKHEFLSDIEKVTQLIPVTVVLATHSSALINSRWDLVEELALEGQ